MKTRRIERSVVPPASTRGTIAIIDLHARPQQPGFSASDHGHAAERKRALDIASESMLIAVGALTVAAARLETVVGRTRFSPGSDELDEWVEGARRLLADRDHLLLGLGRLGSVPAEFGYRSSDGSRAVADAAAVCELADAMTGQLYDGVDLGLIDIVSTDTRPILLPTALAPSVPSPPTGPVPTA